MLSLRCRLFGPTRRNEQTRRQLLQIEFRLNENSTKGYQKIFGQNIIGPKIFERSHFGRIFGRGILNFLFSHLQIPEKTKTNSIFTIIRITNIHSLSIHLYKSLVETRLTENL